MLGQHLSPHQIHIDRRTRQGSIPDPKHERPLEIKAGGMRRLTEAEEESFNGKILEQLLKRPVLLLRLIEQPLMNRCRQIGWMIGHYVSASRYGRITRSTRQRRAY